MQVYISWRNASVPVPQVQLSGLKRGAIKAGTKQTFRFTLTAETFQVWMSDVGFVVESGKYCNSKKVHATKRLFGTEFVPVYASQ